MTWQDDFNKLQSLDERTSRGLRQQRGRDFESVLHDMFRESRMHPHRSYRPAGEEIDGSFVYRSRVCLYEAKWTNTSQAASALYQFRGKVDGKLAGTIGVFFSIAGYSPDTIDALVAGKSLNLVLFDGEDVRALANGSVSIRKALDFKFREAVERGTPYVSLAVYLERKELERRRTIIVEGQSDAAVLRMILQRFGLHRVSQVVVGGGPDNIPRVIASLEANHLTSAPVVVLIDGDGQPEDMVAFVNGQITDYGGPTVAVEVVALSRSLELDLLDRPFRGDGGAYWTVASAPHLLADAVAKTDFRTVRGDPTSAVLLDAIGVTDEVVSTNPRFWTPSPG